jgi:hypothetical protein
MDLAMSNVVIRYNAEVACDLDLNVVKKNILKIHSASRRLFHRNAGGGRSAIRCKEAQIRRRP